VIEVRYVTPDGVEDHEEAAVAELLGRSDGFVWVDIPHCDAAAADMLRDVFAFHSLAIEECLERTHVPKVHAYPRELFVVLLAPLLGHAGHVHLLQQNQFIGHRCLVTVHGPFGEGVPPEAGLNETTIVLNRMMQRRFHPASPMELSYAIVSAIARHMEQFLTGRARQVAVMERTVAQADSKDPRRLVEDMFQLRHQLLTVQTMANQSRDVFSRARTLSPRFLPTSSHAWVEDLLDQFDRVRSLAEGENLFLQGVIDLYQTRVSTKMTVAAERLAVLAALTLPVTAVSSVVGMNVIVNERTRPVELVVLLVVMLAISGVLLRWTKRQGWWG
jgi:Mg2+ and Co2+ transporter CorA